MENQTDTFRFCLSSAPDLVLWVLREAVFISSLLEEEAPSCCFVLDLEPMHSPRQV